MGKSCFGCKNNIRKFMGDIYFPKDRLKSELNDMNIFDSIVNKMNEKDMLCEKCGKKVYIIACSQLNNLIHMKSMKENIVAGCFYYCVIGFMFTCISCFPQT